MYFVTKEMGFEAAHNIVGHNGKCQFVHGHSYVVKITLSSKELNELGMVIDFSDIKRIQEWLDNNWDHKLLQYQNGLHKALDVPEVVDAIGFNYPETDNLAGNIVYLDWNPTAENMAKFLFDKAVSFFQDNRVKIFEVEVYETATSRAIYRGEQNNE